MTTIFNLYGQHGLILNALVLVGLLALGVGVTTLGAGHAQVVSAIKSAWVLAGLALIFIMTLSPFKHGVVEGFESLQVSQVVTHFTQPQTSGFNWPDWHDPIGNIMMTIPLATALALTWTKRWTIMAVFGLSVAIEITQYFYGHGRTAQFSDVLLNTLGGACGVGLAMLCTFLAGKLPKANSGQTAANLATAQPSES
jgi:glycopeptide antibiotics resistance protein